MLSNGDDIPHLACLNLIGGDGYLDVVYHDLIPGLPTNKVVERRLHFDGTTASCKNCVVASHRQAVGMIHTDPADDATADLPDPLIPGERASNNATPTNSVCVIRPSVRDGFRL